MEQRFDYSAARHGMHASMCSKDTEDTYLSMTWTRCKALAWKSCSHDELLALTIRAWPCFLCRDGARWPRSCSNPSSICAL